MSSSGHKRRTIGLALLAIGISSVVYLHYFRYYCFALLSESRKDSIVWHLHGRHQWGLPRQKPICRDLLEHQGYSSVNYGSWTYSAIDLAEKQGWRDLSPLIAKIYERPKDIWLYQRAFLYLRAEAGKSISTNLITSFHTLQAASYYGSEISGEQVSTAKQQILQEPDKEAVMVYAINLAGSSGGKGSNGRGQQAGVDILKGLDRDTVALRIHQLQMEKQAAPWYLQTEELKWIAKYTGIPLENTNK